MDENKLKKVSDVLCKLLPDSNAEIRSLADLTDNPNLDIKELCEAVELINRLSREEGVR